MLPLIESDIFDIFAAVAHQCEPKQLLRWSNKVTMGVVLASKGYPGSYDKGFAIEGVDTVQARIYHMGTKMDNGQLLTAGGRVMMVVSEGDDIPTLKQKVYAEVAKIRCDNLFYRNDIAHRAVEIEN